MLEAIFEAIGYLLREIFYHLLGTLIQKIFYWPGWLILRLITWGRYPPENKVEHNRLAVSLFAIVAMASTPMLFALIAA
jgi:hypothetical protein